MKKNEDKFYGIKHFFKTNRLGTVGFILVVIFIVLGTFAPWIAPFDPNQMDLKNTLSAPDSTHLLGTDHNGRDSFSRIVYGARVSLVIAATSVILGSVTGVILGLIAGWFTQTETIIMRLMDVLLSFPSIIVALTIVSVLGADIKNLIIAIAIGQVPSFARLTHGQVLSIKKREYVLSQIVVGASDWRILFKGILPNILSSLIVQMSIFIPSAIMTASSLSFLGLGVRPPTAEWGGMLQESIKWYRRAPHMMIYPGLALMLVVFGFNSLGDGLRVAMDPKLKNR
jgi:peptide/nickel transport system permease protein